MLGRNGWWERHRVLFLDHGKTSNRLELGGNKDDEICRYGLICYDPCTRCWSPHSRIPRHLRLVSFVFGWLVFFPRLELLATCTSNWKPNTTQGLLKSEITLMKTWKVWFSTLSFPEPNQPHSRLSLPFTLPSPFFVFTERGGRERGRRDRL